MKPSWVFRVLVLFVVCVSVNAGVAVAAEDAIELSAGVEYLAAYGCPSFNPVRLATPRPIVINPDESCHCLSPVPVEQTSWGRVKALYKD